MKYCKNCGSENNDDNQFCFNCRCENFTDQKPLVEAKANPSPVGAVPPMPGNVPPFNPNMPAGQPQVRPYPMTQPIYQRPQKKPLTIADLMAILGFVAALVGMFSASVILHPLAAICALVGFVKGTKFKPLAVAGFVIAIVGGLVYIILSLYRSGLIPQWITFGAFH